MSADSPPQELPLSSPNDVTSICPLGMNTTPPSDLSRIVELQEQILDALAKIAGKPGGEQDHGSEQPTPSGSSEHNAPIQQRMSMTAHQGQPLTSGNDSENYEQILPEDVYGEEAGPNARVFKVYDKEASTLNDDIVREAADRTDAVLIFAGLLSAALTSLVAQTSQALGTDTGEISNSLLAELVQLQRAQENGTSFGGVEHAITETAPSDNVLWVNGLWFSSLALTLATALFAVLVKQWLHEYMVRTSGTARDRSIVRQFRFAGMQQWHVFTIIASLPLLLHLALITFLAGLVFFLAPRSLLLAYVVGSITVIVYCVYFISNLLPIFSVQCPYRTPFSDLLNVLLFCFHIALLFTLALLASVVNATRSRLHRALPWIPRGEPLRVKELPGFMSLSKREQHYMQQESIIAYLSLDIIAWLMKTTLNPSVFSVAAQAVGGLSPSQFDRARDLGKCTRSKDFLPKLIDECLLSSISSPRLERLVRVCPVLMPDDLGQLAGRELFKKFRDANNIEGMVSSLPCLTNPRDIGPEAAVLINRLLRHSPDKELAPAAWLNLFQAVTQRSYGLIGEEFDLTALCAKALQDREGWGCLSWDRNAPRVPMMVALSRSPELVIRIFSRYDTSLELSSDLSPPGLRLRALLALHRFLENTLSQPSSDTKEEVDLGPSIQLLSSVWTVIKEVFNTQQAHTVVDDCTTLYHATTHSLLRSKLLTGHEWKASEPLAAYCNTILEARHLSIYHASQKFGNNLEKTMKRSIWEFLERVADITFPVNATVAASGNHFTSYTRPSLLSCWKTALEHDIKAAYVAFVDAHVLGQTSQDFEVSLLVVAFISGIARRQAKNRYLHHKSQSGWFFDCLEYLHRPENLFAACQILSRHRHNVIPLAQLQPDDIAWPSCRARMKERYPYDDGWRLEARKDSRDALDKFFEKHQSRHKRLLRRFKLGRLLRDILKLEPPTAQKPGITSTSGDVRDGRTGSKSEQPGDSSPLKALSCSKLDCQV